MKILSFVSIFNFTSITNKSFMVKHRAKNPRINLVSPYTGKKYTSWLDEHGKVIRKDENPPLIVIPNEIKITIDFEPVASAPETPESGQDHHNQKLFDDGVFSSFNNDDGVFSSFNSDDGVSSTFNSDDQMKSFDNFYLSDSD